MIFNSISFLIFFLIFFFLYWFVFNKNLKLQNLLILIGSYVFYAWASWKILPILVISTLIFYKLGIAVFSAKSEKNKNLLTALGVISGAGMLLYFKYTNFFISSFKNLFESFGLQTNLHTFNIILPLGISFYTFRLLSYVIDINRGKYEPTCDIGGFSAYVAFFPCLLAGPIDRPNTLIPQLQKKRGFDYDLAVDGCRQILWGAFKKIVVADNCATFVNDVFVSYQTYSGSTLLLGGAFYTFQLYADFSGYSDMAIGLGKLLGFKLTKNFNYPFFAQNIADYWRRWHISLTSWLTDYVFMPLNIRWRDLGNWGTVMAVLITFELIGLWHGANWTFVVFGLYHGLLFIPLILLGATFKKKKMETNKLGLPTLKCFGKILLTFFLVTFGFIIFRSETIEQAVQYMGGIFDKSLLNIPLLTNRESLLIDREYYIPMFVNLCILIFTEWLQRDKEHGLQLDGIKSHIVKFGIYYILIILILWFGKESETFIYFQF
ncbi:MAG: MBOAT family protein [Deltaproteobacteria bacterium]|nr:MBOAT family protein [Deltaproteobacteria bacterium]